MNGMMQMVMGFEGMEKGIKHIPGPEVCVATRSGLFVAHGHGLLQQQGQLASPPSRTGAASYLTCLASACCPCHQGVRGRNSDNKLILEKLGWEPTIKLEVRGAGRSGCV